MPKLKMHIANLEQAADLILMLQKNEIEDLNIYFDPNYYDSLSESGRNKYNTAFGTVMDLIKKNTSLKELGIFEIHLSKVASVLEAIKQNVGLKSILSKVNCDSPEAQAAYMHLLLGLKKIKQVTKLSLQIGPYWNPKSERQMASLLNNNPNLKTLSISIDVGQIEDVYLMDENGKYNIKSFLEALAKIKILDSVNFHADSNTCYPLRHLAFLLNKRPLTSVKFENQECYGFSQHSEEDMKNFCEALSRDNKLNTLSLVELISPEEATEEATLDDVASLMKTIFTHQSIKVLNLSYNALPWEIIKGITTTSKCNIQELKLFGSNLDDGSMTYLAESVVKMEELRHLDLSLCEFGDDGVANFCKKLLENPNPSLTEINFGILCGKKTSIHAYEMIANFANQYPLSYLGIAHCDLESVQKREEDEINSKIIAAVLSILQKNTSLKFLDLREMPDKFVTEELGEKFNFSILLPGIDTAKDLSNQLLRDTSLVDSNNQSRNSNPQQSLPFIESLGGSNKKRKKEETMDSEENPNKKCEL